MHIYGEGLLAEMVAVGARGGSKVGNPHFSASMYTVFLGATGVYSDFMSEESFGGSGWRGRIFLNGDSDGVKDLFNYKQGEHA